MLRVLDLFSGIGGLSLGLERTGGFRTVAFCEIEPYCRAVLAKHWPDVPCYDDVTKLAAEHVGAVDVVCGGFPCQPFSSASAGRARGVEDDRFLWPHMLRLASDTGARWIICENVTQLDGMALEQVVSDLEAIGFTVAPPFEIPACAVGHNHRRSRLWICGHADGNSKPIRPINAKTSGVPKGGSVARCVGAYDGISTRMDRLRALGNAVVPQIPELIGRAILQAEGLVA